MSEQKNEHLPWEEFDKQTLEKIKNMKQSEIETCLIKYFRVIERTRRGMAKHRGPGVVRKKKNDNKNLEVNLT
jgi:hypothetical protein